MNEDLMWLARNLPEWKEGNSHVQVRAEFLPEGGNYVGEGTACFTKEQWIEAVDAVSSASARPEEKLINARENLKRMQALCREQQEIIQRLRARLKRIREITKE